MNRVPPSEFESEEIRAATATHDVRDRSVSGLLRELREETTQLVREEVRLAKAETTQKLARAGRNVASIGVGAFVAYAGVVLLLVACSMLLAVALEAAGLSAAMAAWLGFLIVGVVVGLIGYAMIQKGITTLKRESIVPRQTMESLREDKDWVKEKMSHDAR